MFFDAQEYRGTNAQVANILSSDKASTATESKTEKAEEPIAGIEQLGDDGWGADEEPIEMDMALPE